MAGKWRTLPDGRRVRITVTQVKVSRKGTGKVVAAATAVVIAGSGAAGIGTLGGAGVETGAGSAAESLAGNTAGDVVDSLPGRSLKTRRAEGRESAKRGKSSEAWRKLKFKQLKRKLEHELECATAATGKVQDFLLKTPCTSLDRLLLAVGDGRGNAAVISVVRVGFKTKAQAHEFEKVEAIQGSGDVRPLEIALTLGLTHVRMTGLHYQPRADGTAMVVAEADTATGHVDGPTLDALADVAAYLPLK